MHAGQEVLEALFESTRLARSHSGRLRRPLYVHKERGMPSDTRFWKARSSIANRVERLKTPKRAARRLWAVRCMYSYGSCVLVKLLYFHGGRDICFWHLSFFVASSLRI